MADKGIFSLAFSAGVGALATMTGLYVAKKLKNMFSRKPKMKLFHQNLFLSTRCTWLISELGAESDFELTEEDIPQYAPLKGREGPAELLTVQCPDSHEDTKDMPVTEYKLNSSEGDDDYVDFSAYDDLSNGNIPAVVVNDDFTMIEGAAICMYLADMYGRFLPDLEHKAEYYSWIVYSAATFDNLVKTLHHQMVDTSENQRDLDVLESALRGFHAFARALSETLENRKYLCGDRFTAADCVLGFTLYWAYTIDHGTLLADYPVLQTYLRKLKSRTAFRKTFGEEDTWDWSRYFTTYLRSLTPGDGSKQF